MAVWISMLFTILSAVIGLSDSDRRRKRLLRDIQILDGLKDFGNPFSIRVLQTRIEREFEEMNKPQLFGTGARAFFTLYFFISICSAVFAFLSQKLTLCVVNIFGVLAILIGILVAKTKLKRMYESSKNQESQDANELSAKAKPLIRILAQGIRRGMTEDEFISSLNAEYRAIALYVNSTTQSPAERAYLRQALLSAANELRKEDDNDVEGQNPNDADNEIEINVAIEERNRDEA